MALRTLGLAPNRHAPMVAGGLSFFGGLLNNYMGHAIAATVKKLREHPRELGLPSGRVAASTNSMR